MANSQWISGQNGQPAPSFPPHQPANPAASKRPRSDYEVPRGAPMLSYHGQGADRNYADAQCASSHAGGNEVGHYVNAPYDSYLSSRQSSFATVEGGRHQIPLPPNACSTLFVEGLPADCTQREASHIFRPFIGYKELRLVKRESKHPRSGPVTLCFAEFITPEHAAMAMEALQGYKLDEYDSNSAHLWLQFSRSPSSRPVARRRVNH